MDPKFDALLLAAGRGSRMKSALPKVLHEILGTPMIELVIDRVRDAGAQEVTLVLGHQSSLIREAVADKKVSDAIQEPQRGTAHAVLMGLQADSGDNDQVLIVNGDLPDLDGEVIRQLVSSHLQGDAAFSVATCIVDQPAGMGRIVRGDDRSLKSVVEEQEADPQQKLISEVNLGVYMIQRSKVMPILTEMVSEDLVQADAESYLTRLVEVLVANSVAVAAIEVPVDQQFLQVNDRLGLAQVSRVLQDRIHRQLLEGGVTIVDPASTWIEFGVEIGQDSVIHPQTVIRRGVMVGQGCEIGPFAHLRSGTVIEDDVKIGDFVEVNRSVLRSGVRAKHLAYLGDADVGSGANIGAGAVIANYDGTKKSATVIGEGAFVGSGSVIVAPADIGDGAVVGAGAVVPPGKRVEAGSTVVGVPARRMTSKDDDISSKKIDERGLR